MGCFGEIGILCFFRQLIQYLLQVPVQASTCSHKSSLHLLHMHLKNSHALGLANCELQQLSSLWPMKKHC